MVDLRTVTVAGTRNLPNFWSGHSHNNDPGHINVIMSNFRLAVAFTPSSGERVIYESVIQLYTTGLASN